MNIQILWMNSLKKFGNICDKIFRCTNNCYNIHTRGTYTNNNITYDNYKFRERIILEKWIFPNAYTAQQAFQQLKKFELFSTREFASALKRRNRSLFSLFFLKPFYPWAHTSVSQLFRHLRVNFPHFSGCFEKGIHGLFHRQTKSVSRTSHRHLCVSILLVSYLFAFPNFTLDK